MFFENIGLKLGTLMYYDFLINIVKNIFFSKNNNFDLLNWYQRHTWYTDWSVIWLLNELASKIHWLCMPAFLIISLALICPDGISSPVYHLFITDSQENDSYKIMMLLLHLMFLKSVIILSSSAHFCCQDYNRKLLCFSSFTHSDNQHDHAEVIRIDR